MSALTLVLASLLAGCTPEWVSCEVTHGCIDTHYDSCLEREDYVSYENYGTSCEEMGFPVQCADAEVYVVDEADCDLISQ